MAVLIDSDMLVDLERGVSNPQLDIALGDEDRAISVITVSELLNGVLGAEGAVRSRRQAFVEYLLAELNAIPITQPVARVHAELCTQLSREGHVIGAHKLWIAATALAHGMGLATGSTADFRRVPGLRLVGPSD